MDTPTHEEHHIQPLETNNKQFKIAVTFLFAYNGFFNVTNRNKKFYFKSSLSTRILFTLEYLEELMKLKV